MQRALTHYHYHTCPKAYHVEQLRLFYPLDELTDGHDLFHVIIE